MKPGSRDLYANLIKISTPNNFYPCNLALAAGIGQFHGIRLRYLTGGQCPIIVYKSMNKGKSQGKSGVARMVCYLVSDWKTNKLSPKLSIETIKKKCSFTTCSLYFDDVKNDNFISRNTEGFDDGEVYETGEGIFPKRAEIFFSANYFTMDEQATSDSERICDRLAAIPFDEWAFMPAAEFSRRQNVFKTVVDSEIKPTELVIGEMGDYINSAEFLEKREEFAQWLYDKAEVIKMRTLLTNYGSFYAIHWKLHQIFKTEWEKMGYSWEGFLEWVDKVHVPFLVSQHMEKDHAIHSIRRYINGLMEFANVMSETDVQKFMRICSSEKTKSKHVLAVHNDKKYPDLQKLGHVRLLDLRSHLPSIGGLWDDSTFATFVRNEVDDLDTTKYDRTSMVAKRALLIPMAVFTSAQKMKLCDLTGQKEYYSLADSETPSGVEEIVNSTSTSGIQMRLALTDVSSIHIPSSETMNEISLRDQIFENQDDVPDRSLEREEAEDVISGSEGEDSEEVSDDNVEEYPCGLCSIKASSLPNLIAHMQEHQKSKKKSKQDKRTTKTATFNCEECDQFFARRKDLKKHVLHDHPLSEDSSIDNPITFHCDECDLVAKSAKDLEKHVNKNHGNNAKTSNETLTEKTCLDITTKRFSKSMKANASRNISNVNESFICECGFSSSTKSGVSRHKCHKQKLMIKCNYCEKYCGNAGSLKLHMRSKHKDEMNTIADANITVNTNKTMDFTNVDATNEIVESSSNNVDAANKTVDPISKTLDDANKTADVTNKDETVRKPLIKCDHCEKYCGNAGSLKLHMRAKHKDMTNKSLDTDKAKKTLTEAEVIPRENTNLNEATTETNSKEKNKTTDDQTEAVENANNPAIEGSVRRSSRRRSISNHKSKASASRK